MKKYYASILHFIESHHYKLMLLKYEFEEESQDTKVQTDSDMFFKSLLVSF